MIRIFQCQPPDCLSEVTYALTAYSHQNKPDKVLEIVRSLVSAPWQTLHPLVKLNQNPIRNDI